MKWIFAAISTIFLSSCIMGPKYEKPVIPMPDRYTVSISSTASHQSGLSQGQWWESFHDKTLNILIAKVADSNLDVKMAVARIEEARAQNKVSTSQYFPILSAQALPPTGTGDGNLTQVLGLFLSWVPDFFGKVQSNQKMTAANLEAAVAEHDYAVLSVSAEVANTYWELRGLQMINQILLKNTSADKSIYQTAKNNYRSGKANYIYVVQQDALLETEKAELEQNNAAIARSISKIEILLGENPGMLAGMLSPSAALPSINAAINLGVPATLLRRRPDIIAAERKIAAAHANINAAMADLFPTISVGWLLAWQSTSLAANIFSLKNTEQSYLGTFNAPLINLSLYKIVDLKKRQKAFAVIQYELTVLRALHEVTMNYDEYQYRTKSTEHYNHALKDKKLAFKLLHNLYENGESNFNSLLVAEKDLHKLEIEQVQSNISSHVALVNLYKALGGDIIIESVNAT